MIDINNSDRAAWAAEAIDAFCAVAGGHDEDDETKAKDLITNIIHFLRLNCKMTFEEARGVVESALNMAETEMNEDSDGDDS